MNERLYMVRVPVSNALAYERFLRGQRLPPHPVDDGYGVHCLLGRLFGEHAPKPFSVERQGRGSLRVLGYADRPAEELKTHAERFADPEAWEAVDWHGLASKPMPVTWPRGAVFGFETRVCPVVRGPRHGPCRKGAEVDVFLARAWAAPEAPVEREAVYRDWLADALARSGGARLGHARMISFRRVRLVRRNRARKASAVERPDVRFRGTLAVADPERFQTLLRRGVGRHRSFGFGMLLLRPSGTAGSC